MRIMTSKHVGRKTHFRTELDLCFVLQEACYLFRCAKNTRLYYLDGSQLN